MPADTLDELCSLIVDCPHSTAPVSADPFGYAVGTTAIGSAGEIDLSKARSVDEVTYKTWTARAVPRPGDLIFCREAPVGPVALVPGDTPVCLGQRTMLLRPNPARLDHRWLAYKLRSPATLRAMLSLADGSTVAHVNVAEVRRFGILPPALDEQQRVVAVLGALDDKIESNRRTARALADVALTATAHEASRATELIAVSDLGVQVKEPGGCDRPYIGLDVMPQGSTVLENWTVTDAPTGASWSFEPGDLLYGKLRPYFRKVVVAPIAGRCTREIVVLRPIEPVLRAAGRNGGVAAVHRFLHGGIERHEDASGRVEGGRALRGRFA
jgi:type I restriction enzyme, S subunit